MKAKETFTHFCIDVFITDLETGMYKFWFTQTFATKKLAETWANGFRHANASITCTRGLQTKFKTSEIYKKRRSYKPCIC